MPQILAIAFLNMLRTSPTLPPSAISPSAMSGLFSRAGENHADVVENRGDRRVRLVNGDLDGADAGERGQNGVGDGAGGALQQLVVGVSKRRGRGRDHAGVRNRVDQAVGARGIGKVD